MFSALNIVEGAGTNSQQQQSRHDNCCYCAGAGSAGSDEADVRAMNNFCRQMELGMFNVSHEIDNRLEGLANGDTATASACDGNEIVTICWIERITLKLCWVPLSSFIMSYSNLITI